MYVDFLILITCLFFVLFFKLIKLILQTCVIYYTFIVVHFYISETKKMHNGEFKCAAILDNVIYIAIIIMNICIYKIYIRFITFMGFEILDCFFHYRFEILKIILYNFDAAEINQH